MNSLVVLLSVMALAAASPSGFLAPAVLNYAAPAVAIAPSAVSHQSRIDIKSSPAVITETITPVARNIVSQPAAVIAAPAAYSAYAAPAIAAVAPAAFSTQSRVDIKSTPAVVSTVAAAPIISSYASPIAYSAPAAVYAPSAIAAVPSVFRSAAIGAIPDVRPLVAAINDVAIAAPSETSEVSVPAQPEPKDDLEKEHSVQKRSVSLLSYSAPALPVVGSPVVHTYASSPLVYSAPAAHISSYSVHAPAFARVL